MTVSFEQAKKVSNIKRKIADIERRITEIDAIIDWDAEAKGVTLLAMGGQKQIENTDFTLSWEYMMKNVELNRERKALVQDKRELEKQL